MGRDLAEAERREYEERREKEEQESARRLGFTVDELRERRKLSRDKAAAEAAAKDNIPDEEYERKIVQMSLQLKEAQFREAFLGTARERWKNRRMGDTLSAIDEAELTLRAMKDSEAYWDKKI